MIIKINDNLQFSDWYQNTNSISNKSPKLFTWKRSLMRYGDNALLLEASGRIPSTSFKPFSPNLIFMWSPFFYGSEINYLNDVLREIHPKHISFEAFDIDKAKEFMDNFLIKLVGLTAFL